MKWGIELSAEEIFGEPDERIGSNKISQSEVDWVISQAG
jgi:hypothetical protein